MLAAARAYGDLLTRRINVVASSPINGSVEPGRSATIRCMGSRRGCVEESILVDAKEPPTGHLPRAALAATAGDGEADSWLRWSLSLLPLRHHGRPTP